MLTLLASALSESLIFLPIILGIYLTYRILMITDLTVGGSFALGAAAFAKALTLGVPETFAVGLALLVGGLAGFGVFLLQTLAKIDSLIASILAVFMISSLSFGLMGQPNLSLLNQNMLLANLQNQSAWIFNLALMGLNLILGIGLFALLKSSLGLKLLAYGSNPNLLQRLGHRSYYYLAFGLILSNLLAAFCGAMSAEIDGYADIHMDDGVALTAIGAVVIGIHLIRSAFRHLKRSAIGLELIGCFLGVYLYFIVLHVFLQLNLNPIYLKLCLGLLLAVFLSAAHYSSQRGGRS